MPIQLSKADARRVMVRAQRLTAERPATLLDVVRELTTLQLDPISAVAPSADLVAWSRLGSAYDPAELRAAIADLSVVELRAFLRPAEDLALYTADMAAWPGVEGDVPAWQTENGRWVDDNDACRRAILARLAGDGPLPSRDLPDLCVRPWKSTGWTNDKNVTIMLGFLVLSGHVAVAGRKGRERLWDLASRVYPQVPPVPADEARRLRDAKRLRALGLARIRGPHCPVEPADVADVGELAVVDGVKGEWRVDPELLDAGPNEPRAALLSPFDRLVHDRKRALEVFDFDYQLEMYKPRAARRWGYYALPILVGDDLVGKLDATADRKAGVLRVDAVHEDVPFDPDTADAVHAEIADLATWLGLDVAHPATASR